MLSMSPARFDLILGHPNTLMIADVHQTRVVLNTLHSLLGCNTQTVDHAEYCICVPGTCGAKYGNQCAYMCY